MLDELSEPERRHKLMNLEECHFDCLVDACFSWLVGCFVGWSVGCWLDVCQLDVVGLIGWFGGQALGF